MGDTPDVSATLAPEDKVVNAGETHDFSITFRNDEPPGGTGRITLYDGTLAPQSTITVSFTATVKDLSADKTSFFAAQASQEGDSSFGPVEGDLSVTARA